MEHDLVLRTPEVTLVPLGYQHAAALLDLVDADLWRGLSLPFPRSVPDMELLVLRASESAGTVAFTVLDAVTGAVRGSTSLQEVDRDHRRAVVGASWYGRAWWGGPTNPASKLALLTHCFETWGLHRVAFRVDPANTRSVRAVQRLGAVPEGVLRGHRTASDGTPTDSLSFSILSHEWPEVRTRLLGRLVGASGHPGAPSGAPVAQPGSADRQAEVRGEGGREVEQLVLGDRRAGEAAQPVHA